VRRAEPTIEERKKKLGIDYESHASYRFVED
jgi:hypothetical protein